MLNPYEHADARNLKRKARRIELQAGRASPLLAMQLRLLAAQYHAEAEALMAGGPGAPSRRDTSPMTRNIHADMA